MGSPSSKSISSVDYVVVTESLLNKIVHFLIEPFDPMFSDIHSPVAFTFYIRRQNTDSSDNEEIKSEEYTNKRHFSRPKWKNEFKNKMSENLLNSDLVDILNDIEIMQQNNKDVTQVEIDDVVEKICDTLKNTATSADVKQINSSLPPRSKKPNQTHTDQPWYNENCEKSRKIYFNFRKKYRKLRSSRNLSLLKIASKFYKKDIDKAFTDYHEKMITKKITKKMIPKF